MMTGRARFGTGSLFGKPGEDFRPGHSEVTKRKLTGESNGHELLNNPTGFFVSRSVGDFLKRNDSTETRVIRTMRKKRIQWRREGLISLVNVY